MMVFRYTARGASGDAAANLLRILAGAAAGLAGFLLALGAGPAEARHYVRYHAHVRHGVPIDPGRETESIVIDADTGRVLSEMNADAITYPASLTKMMTLYLTFEALNAGKLRLDQYLPVSYAAASRAPGTRRSRLCGKS